MWKELKKMKTELIDAISNVRVVAGTIRMDAMNIVGQNEDKSFIFEKSSEIAMTPVAFSQALGMMKQVEEKLKENKDKESKEKENKK